MKKTGAQVLCEGLIHHGVEKIFGIPGGAILPLYGTLSEYPELDHILVRHEQGASHAADGFSRITGKTGVCFATSGPGATNLITGMATAMMDSSPMIAITGQVSRPGIGKDSFQEIDITGASLPVTKHNYLVMNANEIPRVLKEAFIIANTGRPGPVLIDITKDAQFEILENFEYKKCKNIRSYFSVPETDPESLKKASELINNAKKPLIVWGQGVILGNAENEFLNFIEKTGIPAAWTILGLSAVPTDHPLNVGMVGMHGNYGPNVLTNECDVLLAIGMRFDDRVTGNLESYAKQAKIIHFEIDPAEVNKNVIADVAILGNVKETLKDLLTLVEENKHEKWVNKFTEFYNIEFKKVIDKEYNKKVGGLSMAEVIKSVNDNTNGESILVTDVGQHQMVACRYTKFNSSKSNITSGGLGTMGFALPAAFGAKIGDPKREVIAVIGDGGFQMTIQELGTIYQTNAAVKIIILNNNFLGMVRQWQQLFFDKRYASTEMINPDFVAIAKGYFIESKKVEKREELDKEIKKMIEFNGPYLLEVIIEKEDNVFPMIPSGSSVSDVRLE